MSRVSPSSLTPHALTLFWLKVNVGLPDECWIWTGGGTRYGKFRLDGWDVGAHRVSWMIEHGAIPAGMLVLHKCDTPKCVNPSHLFVGTCGDNLRDMWSKGRNAAGSVASEKRVRGEQHGCARLTEREVIEARRLRGTGEYRLIDLARLFSVGTSTIHDALTGTSWKHLPSGDASACIPT